MIKDKVKNHDFYLGSVAYVYKIKCQTWQIDDFGGVHMKYQGQEQPFIHILH